MLIITIIAFIIIAVMDLPSLIKKKNIKDMIIYLIFFTSAFVFALLLSFDVAIPSPMKGVQYLIKDILHLNYQ